MYAILGLALAFVTLTSLVVSASAIAPGPAYSIKDVMKEGMKGKLVEKVASGAASAEEKAKLLDMATSLWESKPPRGETESWMKLTGNFLAASSKAVTGKKDAAAALKKAANCKACHSSHKPAK